MNEPVAALGADNVLDFSDIVLITMSSSSATGRVNAASICSCGPVGPAASNAYDGGRAGVAMAPSPATLGARIYRFVAGAFSSLRAS